VLKLDAFRRLPDGAGDPEECDRALVDIAALSGGKLDAPGRQRLAVHLVQCTTCRETAVMMTVFAADLDDLPQIGAPAAPPRVEAPITKGDDPPAPPALVAREPSPRAPKRTWAVAAAILVLAVIAVFATTAGVIATREPPSADKPRQVEKNKRAREIPLRRDPAAPEDAGAPR
jgi:hypothetical protein